MAAFSRFTKARVKKMKPIVLDCLPAYHFSAALADDFLDRAKIRAPFPAMLRRAND
jgi:hypothetical protein